MKNLVILVILSILVSTSSLVYATLDQNNTQAWIYEEASGDLLNQVGVRNGSTSGVTYQSNGANNFGYFFDGNDYVDFGANFFLNGLSEMTMCSWFNISSTAANREVISYQDAAKIGRILIFTSGKVLYRASLISTEPSITGDKAVGLNKWNLACVVYNGTHLVPYLNGTLDGTPIAATGNVAQSIRLVIGAQGNGFGNKFVGNIDETSIWDRGLSASEVSDLFLTFYPYAAADTCTAPGS